MKIRVNNVLLSTEELRQNLFLIDMGKVSNDLPEDDVKKLKKIGINYFHHVLSTLFSLGVMIVALPPALFQEVLADYPHRLSRAFSEEEIKDIIEISQAIYTLMGKITEEK